jgi:DNA (cytosine-5)-methyltransferase 1
MMRGATCFSGIGAPEAAAPWVEWAWCAEVEPFPAAVHAARHPGGTNLGDVLAADFLERAAALGPLEVLVGGPPCQAFSVAGSRLSLADPRGNLSLRWVQIIHAIDPVWHVTENVPGWLSTPDNAFGCFLGAVVGADAPLRPPAGGSWPDAGMAAGPRSRAGWRILDAQYFGLAQRRRRVFVVGSARAGCDPAAVLFEPAGLQGDFAPGREARERAAPTLAARTRGGGGLGADFECVTPCGRMDFETETLVTHSLRAAGFDASEDGTGRGTPLVRVAFNVRGRAGGAQAEVDRDGIAAALRTASGGSTRTMVAVAFAENSRAELRLEGGDGQTTAALKTGGGKPGQSYPAIVTPILAAGAHGANGAGIGREGDPAMTLDTTGLAAVAFHARQDPDSGAVTHALDTDGHSIGVHAAAAVRRLMPVECERLQGFPDGFTSIAWRGKPAADGPRYKALGNSMAVPVMRWLLERLPEGPS